MAFMKLETMPAGTLYELDCPHCLTSNYWHEWIDEGQGSELHTEVCTECGRPMKADEEDVTRSENMFACRFSAPGYMDCTDWSYGPDRAELEAEVNDMYGDDSDEDDEDD